MRHRNTNGIPNATAHREAFPWNAARSTADIGVLTARWLDGDLPDHPGYFGPPDPETTDLIPILAATNRNGFITLDSQPGTDPARSFDGAVWRQRAVHGLLDPHQAEHLTAAAIRAGLIAVACPQSRANGLWTTVTERDGQPVSAFGGGLDHGYLRDQFHWCPRAARADLCRMTHVALIDPTYAPTTTLWDVLAQWLRESGQSR